MDDPLPPHRRLAPFRSDLAGSGRVVGLGARRIEIEDDRMSVASISPTIRPLAAPLRIGPLVVDPPVLQAPMAGFTNFAFRQIVREYGGAGLQATEMINAKGFAWLDEHEAEHPDPHLGFGPTANDVRV
jgi:hypothetical protein